MTTSAPWGRCSNWTDGHDMDSCPDCQRMVSAWLEPPREEKPLTVEEQVRKAKRLIRKRLTRDELVKIMDAIIIPQATNSDRVTSTLASESLLLVGRRGSSIEYSIDRLIRHRPDVAAKLRSGEYRTVNQAMVAAGLMERFLSVPITNVERTADSLERNLSKEDFRRLVKILKGKAR